MSHSKLSSTFPSGSDRIASTESCFLTGKRNTSRPVFTSHERALAKSNWAQSSARLDRDSFLPFGSCGLCLGIAREPVACQQGDIFCRECALANLLAQKRELRRAKKARRDADSEAGRIEALKSEEDNERSVRDFELIQAGLSSADSQTGYNAIVASDSPSGPPLPSGSKRKFVLDEEEVKRVSREDKIKARKAIEAEKVGLDPCSPALFSRRTLNPDAWIGP